MMRQAMMVVCAAAAIGMLAPGAASARGGFGHGGGFHGGFGGGFYRGYGYGWGYGPGFYYGPGYYYGYPYDGYGGGCYRVRQRVHTRNGWHYRIVRVCD